MSLFIFLGQLAAFINLSVFDVRDVFKKEEIRLNSLLVLVINSSYFTMIMFLLI